MSLTVHPSDGPNLPARIPTLFRAARIPTHRQLIRAQMAWETYHFTRQVSSEERGRFLKLFETVNIQGGEISPFIS